MAADLERMTLQELEIFLDLSQVKSIREVARLRKSEVAQISRTLKRLETRLNVQLFERSPKGLTPTTQGLALQKIASSTLNGLKSLGQRDLAIDKDAGLRLGQIGAPTFLASYYISSVLGYLYNKHGLVDTDLCEIAPHRLVLTGLQGIINIAIHAGKLDWPKSWHSTKVGTIKWQLYGSKKTFGSKVYTQEQLLDIPFIYPTYWAPEGLRTEHDQFPIPLRRRKKSFGVSSVVLALGALKESNCLVYLPEIAICSGVWDEITTVTVKDLPEFSESIYLSVHEEKTSQQALRTLQEELEDYLTYSH